MLALPPSDPLRSKLYDAITAGDATLVDALATKAVDELAADLDAESRHRAERRRLDEDRAAREQHRRAELERAEDTAIHEAAESLTRAVMVASRQSHQLSRNEVQA
jgi:hypothetical protein